MTEGKRRYLTTSWDDGDPLDLRLAEKLATLGVRGTFYLCRDYGGRPRLTDAQILELSTLPGVEIGAHSLNHPDLRRLSGDALRQEVAGSRAWLEDLVGRPVVGFCYPNGLHNARAVRAVTDAGFIFGRTTKSSTTHIPRNMLRAGTTLQLYPHTRHVQLRHALKERDVRGARQVMTVRHWPQEPAALAAEFLESTRVASFPQLFHLWGHSWELQSHNLWGELENVIRVLTESPVTMLTNGEIPAIGQ